jgi:hypothetical protein
MPLNTNILGGIQYGQSPAEQFQNAMSIANNYRAMQQQAIAQQQAQAARQRELAENEAIKQAYGRYATPDGQFDQSGFLGEVGKINPNKAMEFQTKFDAHNKFVAEVEGIHNTNLDKVFELNKKEMAFEDDKNNLISSYLDVIKTPEQYKAIVVPLARQYRIPVEQIPDEYSPNVKDNFIKGALAQKAERDKIQLDFENNLKLKKQKTDEETLAETKRSNLADESNARYTKLNKPDAESKQNFTQEQQLRSQFQGATKDYRSVRDAYNRIEASAKNPSAAGDLSLIFNYMKILDPGSTVREGEFANAQNSGSIPSNIRNVYNKAISGQRLNENQRRDFLDRSKSLFNAQDKTYKGAKSQYTKIANKYNLDPENVVGGFDNEEQPTEDNDPLGIR